MVARNSSLSWYGFAPVGLYHSLDQPPILVMLMGLRFTVAARGARARASGFIASQRGWLVVERLPGYAPELNPVEGLWPTSRTKSSPTTPLTTLRTLRRRPVKASGASGDGHGCCSPSLTAQDGRGDVWLLAEHGDALDPHNRSTALGRFDLRKRILDPSVPQAQLRTWPSPPALTAPSSSAQYSSTARRKRT
jgi:hypothetical protein